MSGKFNCPMFTFIITDMLIMCIYKCAYFTVKIGTSCYTTAFQLLQCMYVCCATYQVLHFPIVDQIPVELAPESSLTCASGSQPWGEGGRKREREGRERGNERKREGGRERGGGKRERKRERGGGGRDKERENVKVI